MFMELHYTITFLPGSPNVNDNDNGYSSIRQTVHHVNLATNGTRKLV